MRVKPLLAASAVLPLIALAPPTQQQSIDLEMSVQPGQLLDIDLPEVTGRIEIIGGSDDTFAIEGTVSAREWRDDNEVIVDRDDDGIRIYSEYLESRRGNDNRRIRAELTIRVPQRFDVELTSAMETALRDIDGRIGAWTGNNDLEARGLTGDVELAVANGNLRVSDSDFAGELSNTNGSLRFSNGSFRGELSSTNGGAELDRISGDLEIRATNATVRLGDVAGSLRGETTNGSVRAGAVAGAIDLETVNGSISATLAESVMEGERVRVATLNGSVEIEAPADLSATFDLRVRQTEPERNRDRPEIRSDFPLEVGAGEMRGGDYYRAATGAAGNGGQRIEVHTTNGDVIIRTTGGSGRGLHP